MSISVKRGEKTAKAEQLELLEDQKVSSLRASRFPRSRDFAQAFKFVSLSHRLRCEPVATGYGTWCTSSNKANSL